MQQPKKLPVVSFRLQLNIRKKYFYVHRKKSTQQPSDKSFRGRVEKMAAQVFTANLPVDEAAFP
jgi:hypothetical protein